MICWVPPRIYLMIMPVITFRAWTTRMEWHLWCALKKKMSSFFVDSVFWSPRVTFVACLSGGVIYMSCQTYDWVTWRIWMSRAIRMNESRHVYGWDMWRIWMSYVTHMNELRHTFYESHVWMSYVTVTHMSHPHEWVTSHVWVTRMNELCHTYYESHIWMNCVTHMSHTHEWVKSHIWVTHMN